MTTTTPGPGLRRLSLAATLCLTSHAEYAAGVAAGLPIWHPWGEGGHAGLPIGLPWLLPVAIDCYVVDALERRKGMDRWAALGILALSVIGGSAYVAPDIPGALKAAGVGVVLVMVLARLYAPARPSKADIAAAASANAERQAEADHQARAEQRREQEASRLRMAEADHLASIEADRARAEAERLRTASAAEIARLAAQSAAEVARIQAEAAVASANAQPQRPRTPAARRDRTAPGSASAPTTRPAPDKDDAARWVASSMRDHQGEEPYAFEWKSWAEKHGGGRTFWFAAKQAAESPVHLAKASAG